MTKKKTSKIVDFSTYSGYIPSSKPEKGIKKRKKKNRQKKSPKGKIIFFLILLLILGICYVCLFTPLFNINKITIKYTDDSIIPLSEEVVQEETGETQNDDENMTESYFRNSKYTDNEIVTMSNILIGNNIFKEDLSKAEEAITNAPYIKKAIIARKFPGEVIISIEERTVKAYIDYVGSYVCIDEEGYMLDSIKKEDKNSLLPIITGITPKDIVKGFTLGELIDADDPIKLQRIVNLFNLINKNEIDLSISNIDVTNKDNVVITIDNGDKKIEFGDMSNMNSKIIYLKKILQDIQGKKGTIKMNSSDDDLRPIFSENIGG